jgi:hypothetical protein
MELDLIGGMLVSASVVVVVNGLISALDVSGAVRIGLATLVGLWVGLQVSLASAGALSFDLFGRVPLIGIMVVAPPLVVGGAALIFPAVRSALTGLPTPLLVGLNATRIVGLFFVLLAVAGRMDGPFPLLAGWGDVVTAALAVPLALLISRRLAGTAAIASWNVLGVIDLVLAVVLGTISFNGGAGPIPGAFGGAEIEALPWALIPTVLVPAYLVMHGIIFAQLLAARSRATLAAGA